MENVIDINIEPVEYDTEHIFLRATQDGKVEPTNNTIQVACETPILAEENIEKTVQLPTAI